MSRLLPPRWTTPKLWHGLTHGSNASILSATPRDYFLPCTLAGYPFFFFPSELRAHSARRRIAPRYGKQERICQRGRTTAGTTPLFSPDSAESDLGRPVDSLGSSHGLGSMANDKKGLPRKGNHAMRPWGHLDDPMRDVSLADNRGISASFSRTWQKSSLSAPRWQMTRGAIARRLTNDILNQVWRSRLATPCHPLTTQIAYKEAQLSRGSLSRLRTKKSKNHTKSPHAPSSFCQTPPRRSTEPEGFGYLHPSALPRPVYFSSLVEKPVLT
ncbi:hypothetical protein B0J13DRAFT_75693 [Dactylonectria estremocensis]|uniref:Uncharacterized protein n=1 Tax=Dactylonectria estremocensis TaxID=1079267 RepID=A0A9P9IVN0_9HYPO|nr:hypothetical protein B0J13DRAFT_75693 [Dactylonectria estremocensis]